MEISDAQAVCINHKTAATAGFLSVGRIRIYSKYGIGDLLDTLLREIALLGGGYQANQGKYYDYSRFHLINFNCFTCATKVIKLLISSTL
jgi:hypothetical protein